MSKLEKIIANIFELDPSQIKKEMTPADIETWDSLSQLNLISAVEKEFKIKSYPDRNNIGIWVKSGNNSMKIAAIGIRVKKWIAYHGFALNVSNDLTKYKKEKNND